MLRKWGTLVFLLLATPLLAMSQNTGKLAGQVLDTETGEALPGASIALAGTQVGTISDIDGNYFIIGVPVGTFDVQASFVGYQHTDRVERRNQCRLYTRNQFQSFSRCRTRRDRCRVRTATHSEGRHRRSEGGYREKRS